MKKWEKITAVYIIILLGLALAGCSAGRTAEKQPAPAPQSNLAETAEKNGDVYILFTSDVHCAVDQGFGYAGLQQIRDTLEAEGYTTLLVDDGDAIQGEAIGTLTKGEAVLNLMNALHYDAAIPGNHEFDYGMERFLQLAEKAEFPYISCNFRHEGNLVFAPYVMKEAAGLHIAFVGVTTPKTITSSHPAYFQNEAGEYVYDFMQDETGEMVYQAVQKAVDAARAEGADYVYVLGHLGLEATVSPWTYADVIAHTSGIDVFFDGHSHDTEQVVMKNRAGQEVVRSACGTKLNGIGYSHISAEKGIMETNIWSWQNQTPAPDLLGIRNSMTEEVEAANETLQEQMGKEITEVPFILTVNDHVGAVYPARPRRQTQNVTS